MISSASAPTLSQKDKDLLALLDSDDEYDELEQLPEDESNLVDPLKARPGLLPMVEWYIGPEVKQTSHENNVTKLIDDMKIKVQRKLEVPDWAIVEPVYDKEQVKDRAIGARTNDTLFPMWVKKRKDFQRVFNRFNERVIPINMRVVVPIRKHPEERSDDDVKIIMKWVRQFDSLCHLNKQRLRIVCQKIKHKELVKGEKLYQQGDTEQVYYMVVSGSLRTYSKPSTASSSKTRSKSNDSSLPSITNGRKYKASDDFGQDALELNNTTSTRQETCEALESHTIVAMLRGYTYRESMKNFESMRTNSNRDFLESSVPLVNGWSWQRLLQLAEMLELERYPAGSTIAKQGDPAEKMYFIRKGTVSIMRAIEYVKSNKWPTSKHSKETITHTVKHNVELDKSFKGDYCCEEGVLGLNIRKCTVVAQTPVELLSLTKEDANMIISRQAKKIMSKRVEKRFQSSDDVAKEYLMKKHENKAKEKAKSLTYGIRYYTRKKNGERKRLADLKEKLWKEKLARMLQKKALEQTLGSPSSKKKETKEMYQPPETPEVDRPLTTNGKIVL